VRWCWAAWNLSAEFRAHEKVAGLVDFCKWATCPWVLLYIERWLKASVMMEDGSLEQRDRGTPQRRGDDALNATCNFGPLAQPIEKAAISGRRLVVGRRG
jgi:hypothetical protein